MADRAVSAEAAADLATMADRAASAVVAAAATISVAQVVSEGGSAATFAAKEPRALRLVQGGSGIGGAVFNQAGTMVIENSTITGNAARGGDAVASPGQSGGAFGGGVFNLDGNVTLTNATIANNTVTAGATAFVQQVVGTADGGELVNGSYYFGAATTSEIATITVSNSIISHTGTGSTITNYLASDSTGSATINAPGPNIVFGTVTNLGGPVSGTPFTNADPNLGPLANNGGFTFTMAPNAGSPAIDAGSNTAASGLTTDQRGGSFVRAFNGTVDLGAFEVQPPPPPVTMAAVASNSGEVVVTNANTGAKILDFRPFDTATSKYIGQMSLALGDVNGDGETDLIVATRGTRAGKIKVFDGAGIVAGRVTQPTQTILVAFPVSGYKQGLTVASADVNGDGIDDIVAASRTSTGTSGTRLPATVVVYAGADTGAGGTLSGATIGSFQPIGTATDGIYVTAGDTTGDGKAEIAVSSANRSLVKIYQWSSGVFNQLGGNLTPFGATAFAPGNGDGQICAVNVGGSTTVDFEFGRLDTTGAVDLQLVDGSGGNLASYSKGSNVSFFALDSVDVAKDNNGKVMLARVTPAGGASIDLLDPTTGTADTPLNGFLTLAGKVTVAG